MLSFLKLPFLCSLHAGAWWESYTCLVGGERTSKRGAWGREIHSHHVAQLQEATFLAALEHLYKEPHVHPEAVLPSTPDPYDAVSLKLSFFSFLLPSPPSLVWTAIHRFTYGLPTLSYPSSTKSTKQIINKISSLAPPPGLGADLVSTRPSWFLESKLAVARIKTFSNVNLTVWL